MVVSAAPASQTGPTLRASNSTKSVRQRLETIERNVSRLQANRTPSPLLLHELANAPKMSKVQDQEVPIYDAATGQYVPGQITELGPFDGSFIQIITSGSESGYIQIYQAGCGPMLIEGPSITMVGPVTIDGSLIVNGGSFQSNAGTNTLTGNTVLDGTVTCHGLPSSNPHVAGELYLVGETVTMSTG